MKKTSPLLPIFITVFIDMLGVGIIIPVFAPLIIRNDHGMLAAFSREETRNLIYGLLTATFPFFQFFGAPVLGALSDVFGRKRILQISLVGTLTGYILFASAISFQSLGLLFLARAIPGFMGGNISIVMAAMADISAPSDRAKNFGLIGMAFGLGFILGPFLGGVLSSKEVYSGFTYATPLWFTALLTLLNIYFVHTQFPDLKPPIRSAKKGSVFTGFRNLRRALEMVKLRTIFTTLFLYSLGFSFFMQFFQVFLIRKFNFSQKEIGLFFGYLGLWIAFSQGVITRYLSGRYRSEQILRVSLIGLSIALFCVIIPENFFWLLLIQPFVAIFQGLSMPNTTGLVSNLASADEQGEILGIQQSIQSVAFTIPPLVAGVVVSIDYRLPILLGSVLIFIAWMYFSIRYKSSS